METSPHMYEGPSPTDPKGPTAEKVKHHHTMTTTMTSANDNNNNNANNNNNHGTAGHLHELAELTSSEISLDLQGLIDDTHFNDDNLFGDLVEAKKNELNHGYGLPTAANHHPHLSHHHSRTSPTGSLGGSSGQSSPVGTSGPHESPTSQYASFTANNTSRNTLAYLPGSVHTGYNSNNNNVNVANRNSHVAHAIQVKQEPPSDHHLVTTSYHLHHRSAANASNNNGPVSTSNNSNNSHSHNYVSSTTPTAGVLGGAGGPPAPPHPTPVSGAAAPPFPATSTPMNTVLPSLKSFAQVPKYLQPTPASIKKKVDRNSDEYRRRRERNNVAVRKSREKAKARTRETEERVKILSRENERLQKKVELLQEELSVLRSLFSNVGVLPEHIHRELAKHIDNFQQQHNAMACM